MPNEPSPPGIAHTLFFALQTRGTEFLHNERLRSDILLGTARRIIRNGLDAVSNAPATPGAAPLEELDVLRPQTYNSHQAMNTDGVPVAVQGQHLLGNNSSLTLTPADLGETGQPPAGGEAAIRSQHTRMWIALIFGILSLIVVPGLVLGVVTGQLPWGIALCGAMATVVSFFASLYYHHNPVRG